MSVSEISRRHVGRGAWHDSGKRAGRRLRYRLALCVAFAGLAVAAVGAAPTLAAECSTCAPWWHLTSSVLPSTITPGGEGTIVVQATNLGDAPTGAGAVTISDVIPSGFTVVEKEGVSEAALLFFGGGSSLNLGTSFCNVQGRVVTCTLEEELAALIPRQPYEYFEIRIAVKAGGVSREPNQAEVVGGGAPPVRVEQAVPVGEAPPAFGVENYELVPEEQGGGVDTQAGSHPFQLTQTLALNQTSDVIVPPALVRNLQFKLPPGLVGNTTALPQCSELDFRRVQSSQNFCPASSVIGVALVTFIEPRFNGQTRTWPLPVFNLVPARGEPARFGFLAAKTPVTIDTAVRTGSDYGVTVSVSNNSELVNFLSSTVVIWGVPGDPRHDSARSWPCLGGGFNDVTGESCPTSTPEGITQPFLTMPTSCTTPFSTSMQGESWPRKATSNPSETPISLSLPEATYGLKDGFGRPLGVTGCNQLTFDPSIEVAPDGQQASTPTGLKVDVRVPQEVNENAEGLASSAVKDITVAFPEGVTVNPASANGLEACSEAEVGFTGEQNETDQFTPELANPFCPNASKVGTVKIKVPVISHPLEGSLYLAAQNANPFGSLLATYIVAEDPISGVRVKLAGEVTLNGETGQVVSTFKNSPQAPLEEAEIHLFGGSRAPFATPAHCGTYTTNAAFDPWSGNNAVSSSSSFAVTSGPNGSPCPGSSLPFAPTLASGTTNIAAGAFSPLTTTLSREDGNQDIQTVQLHYPPGLLGILSGIKLCPEAQANAGTCPPESLLGHTVVSVGLGNEPFTVTGGEAFLTEGYKGAPFGLSIVNPAVAGPFNLGKVIVRAKVELDPHTLQLTVTTDAIPHILDGIPLEIKHVNVTVDRPGFTFNPTNCSPMSVTGTLTSVQGASSPVSTPFQVTNCALLKFAPKFTVSTSGKTSKAKGASLSVKLAYPNAPLGTYANIAKVKVDLPKQLPSRLTTLQKACLAAVFEANPAYCPAASIVGYAKVITQTLPVPLTGPAYFVSHGGEAFPNLIIVLQGYGVTADLVGSTLIRHGITSSTFRSTPDAPFETFELTLPEGKDSALAANANLCKSKLNMPTAFVAQNGAEIHQTTKIAVTGCRKAKAKRQAKKKRKRK